jgi:hypothetical protein
MTERIIVGADGRYYITTEPKTNEREWQGLTYQEIKEILDCGRSNLVNIKKAEQRLKEKNT